MNCQYPTFAHTEKWLQMMIMDNINTNNGAISQKSIY